jgi:uncharacterized membrane protein YagU involved in acid resistance
MATRAAIGALAGLAATVPMSVALEVMRQRLPPQERSSLPPKRIATRAARRMGLRVQTNQRRRDVVTLVTHFGFGAAAGTLYAPLASRLDAQPPVLRGMSFGVAVWLVSYMGWLPAVGLFGPATKDTRRRTALMIAAHLVWGACVGLLVEGTERSRAAGQPRLAAVGPDTVRI